MQKKRSKANETLEQLFQKLNRNYVKIKRKDRKNNNIVLYSVLEELLKKMRACDKLFCSMKPKLEYLGSYFDGLRVGHPTEYDLNVILTIHINYKKILLDGSETQDGYTSIKMPSEFRRLSKTPHTASKGFKNTELWCDSAHRFSVKKFRSWMQSVVDAAVNTLPIEDNKRMIKVNNKFYHISTKMSGPANTITIMENENIIDIDLVPTLEFKLPKIPIKSNIDFSKVISTNVSHYFAVPKPTGNDFSWRLAFPFQERYIINHKNNLKSTLKILKLLRDVQGFKKLASYYIKTLFLWETTLKDDAFWKKNSLSYLVLYMLIKLRDCLSVKKIRNFWCPDHNLLEKTKSETCENWCNRLSHIIDDIEQNKNSNPHVLFKYFIKDSTTQGCMIEF